METTPILSVLVFSAFGLLVALTGGIGYLTYAEWRDRRRQVADNRQNRQRRKR